MVVVAVTDMVVVGTATYNVKCATSMAMMPPLSIIVLIFSTQCSKLSCLPILLIPINMCVLVMVHLSHKCLKMLVWILDKSLNLSVDDSKSDATCLSSSTTGICYIKQQFLLSDLRTGLLTMVHLTTS